ncbi:GDYXXLXY domain-containing protein [Desulfococcaceae bacterium HSG8]|nr:GDYXXLXY domain-containing protein [Desulfococcaceae bacterium HSG8]
MNTIIKPSRYHLLIIAVVMQILILAGEYLNSVYPIWIGEKIELAVRPVDPRSLFRGNYARLDYDIETIGKSFFDPKDFRWQRRGTIVYVALQRQGEIWVPKSVSLKKPEQGIFIRGRLMTQTWKNVSKLKIRYGTEAYFAPPDKARAIENELRKQGRNTDRPGATAEIMVAPNGKAVLTGVKIDGVIM